MRWRINLLLLVILLASAGFVYRLFAISIVDHVKYVARAKEQQNIVLEITPRRGDIYVQDQASRTLSLVAQSSEVYALSATPKFVKNKKEYAELIGKYFDKNISELQMIFDQDGMYMNPIKQGMTKDQVEIFAKTINDLQQELDSSSLEVKVNFDDAQGDIIYFINGLFFVKGYQRIYPEGATLGQLLGFVNDKGEGQYGFEGRYDRQLQGYAGKMRLERDSSGNLLSERESVDWKNGTTYELSIDRNIQHYVEQELANQVKDSEAQGGSVIIMNPKTGEIVSMASTPSFDPNNFRTIAKDNINLFENPVISQIWEPGSIMKPLIMSMALDNDLVKPDTKETFQASVTVNDYVINTALRRAYGEETMTQVLTNSDNVAMVWVANKIGNDNMFKYLQAYGFGAKTGIDLQNEIESGILPLNQWRDINRATMSFGQGIAVTPIQVLTAYTAVANNGKIVKPRVVHATVDDQGKRTEIAKDEGVQVIKPETAKQLKEMMVATVLNGHARAGVTGYKIGGKTGTAQVPDSEKGGYIEDAYNHSFVGFGPSDDPQFLMLVKIDRPNLKKVGMFAESTAVPLFGRISQFLVNYYQIMPTNN